MKHNIPIGTPVSFNGDSHIYYVVDYQDLLLCEKPCNYDHDYCYNTPHITVEQRKTISLPLADLKHVFDSDGKGRIVSYAELLQD